MCVTLSITVFRYFRFVYNYIACYMYNHFRLSLYIAAPLVHFFLIHDYLHMTHMVSPFAREDEGYDQMETKTVY